MMDKFNEFSMLQNQAKKFEQGGLDDKALEIYLRIVDEYMPNNDYSFDRAAILLEKKYKYSEAIGICKKAIEKIESGDLQGDPEKFQKKIERIQLKAKNDTSFQEPAEKKEPEAFHFGLPGFRSTNKLTMVLGLAYYSLAVFSSYPDQLYIFLFMFALAFVGSYGAELMMKLANKKTCKKAFSVVLISLVIAGYSIAQVPQVKVYWDPSGTQLSEGDGSGTGDGTAPAPDTDRLPPEIPVKYLEAMANTAAKHPGFDNAYALVDMGTVVIDLVVMPGTSQDSIQSIAEDMVRTLGGLMTSENLKGPDDGSFGEVYDFYGVTIEVTDTLQQPVNEGTLLKDTNEIRWSTL